MCGCVGKADQPVHDELINQQNNYIFCDFILSITRKNHIQNGDKAQIRQDKRIAPLMSITSDYVFPNGKNINLYYIEIFCIFSKKNEFDPF